MKILLHVLLFCRERRRCRVRLLTDTNIILHIKTFVIFDFDPYFTSRLITESDEFSGIDLWMIGLQNCKDRTVEKFDLAPKKWENLCAFPFFFVGYSKDCSV